MSAKTVMLNIVVWVAFILMLVMLYGLFTADFLTPVGGNPIVASLFALGIAYTLTFGVVSLYGTPSKRRFLGFFFII